MSSQDKCNYTAPTPHAGYYTRSINKASLNSEFPPPFPCWLNLLFSNNWEGNRWIHAFRVNVYHQCEVKHKKARVTYPDMSMCEIDIGNPKYTRNTLRLLSSGTKLFITFELRVFRHEERETQSFYADCFYIVSSQPNQRAAPVAHKFVWPHPALNLDSLVRRQEINSQLFLKSPKIHGPRFWCMTSFTPPGLNFLSGIFILTSLNDSSSLRAREDLR